MKKIVLVQLIVTTKPLEILLRVPLKNVIVKSKPTKNFLREEEKLF